MAGMAADAFYAQSPTEKKHDERKPLVPNQERYTVTLYMIADVLPSDPERKLEVAQGIINAAFRQKAAEMGGELQRLRTANADKDSRIRVLESRLAECQDSLRDARSQLQSSLEQNDALQSERASLTNSLRKLEAFKRNLLHTLQASDVVGTEGAGALSSGENGHRDREDEWAKQAPAKERWQPNGSGSTAQTPLQEPASYQQEYLSSTGHAEKSARPLAASSEAFSLSGNGPLQGQPPEAPGPFRPPGGSHVSPARHSEHAEHSAAQHQPDPYTARRASHDGTYQARDVTRLSPTDTGLGRTYHEPLDRSHFGAEPRAVSGGNDSLLHIPSDVQSSAEGHASYPGHEVPLSNGRGDHRIHQQGHGNRDESPRDAYHVSYQVPGSYVAASARPQRPEYNEAFDDRSPPRDGYPHSAREPPAQEAPQSKDRSEGREFFRRARARLSNEAFSAFLQAIKDMNAGITGRSETLQTAGDIFAGPDVDLYHDFRALLDSHLPSK